MSQRSTTDASMLNGNDSMTSISVSNLFNSPSSLSSTSKYMQLNVKDGADNNIPPPPLSSDIGKDSNDQSKESLNDSIEYLDLNAHKKKWIKIQAKKYGISDSVTASVIDTVTNDELNHARYESLDSLDLASYQNDWLNMQNEKVSFNDSLLDKSTDRIFAK